MPNTPRKDWLINLAAASGLVLVSSGLYAWFGWPPVAVLLGFLILCGASVAALK